ncbi:DUF2017 domain-containing protein [Oryzobacter telluris]|uniref:DUF2017 domain-containing protein n=1 Tax=Oryzobacter telluris TaxID=3149179 RepID=UPI00370D0035
MARGFRRRGEGDELRFTARLDGLERATVAGLMDQVHDLLDPADAAPEGDDDFSSIVAGLGMGVTVAGEDQDGLEMAALDRDPALNRLLPNANREDDEVAAEFRRLTETGLRQRKAGALAVAAATLRHDDKVRLSEADARAFLTALTDVRLVLGERMGLRTDEDLEALEAAAHELDDDDPLGYALAVYDFLTWLQETLATAMLGR